MFLATGVIFNGDARRMHAMAVYDIFDNEQDAEQYVHEHDWDMTRYNADGDEDKDGTYSMFGEDVFDMDEDGWDEAQYVNWLKNRYKCRVYREHH